MEYKILSSSSPESLTNKVNNLIKEGWLVKGSHQVVVTHQQNRFRGDQHVDTLNEVEYTQTMVKYDENETESYR